MPNQLKSKIIVSVIILSVFLLWNIIFDLNSRQIPKNIPLFGIVNNEFAWVIFDKQCDHFGVKSCLNITHLAWDNRYIFIKYETRESSHTLPTKYYVVDTYFLQEKTFETEDDIDAYLNANEDFQINWLTPWEAMKKRERELGVPFTEGNIESMTLASWEIFKKYNRVQSAGDRKCKTISIKTFGDCMQLITIHTDSGATLSAYIPQKLEQID